MPRVLLSAPAMVLVTLVLGAASLLTSLVDRTGRLPHRLAAGWARFLLILWGVEVVVAGLEHLPAGPAVYAANHASALDIPILFGHLPVNFRVIYKRSLVAIPIVGWHLFLGGHVSIERANAFSARRSLSAAARRIAQGASMVVFPEGTRSRDGTVQPFKKGSFVLAREAGVPVVPVSIDGVKRLAPRGLLRLRPGTVHLTVHPAVSTATVGAHDLPGLAERVRAIVRSRCAEA